MSEQKQPKVRFSGFDDAWEQRKLDKVAEYRNGKGHEKSISSNGKYIVVNSKFVSTNGLVKKFTNIQMEPLVKGDIAFVLSDVPNGRALARTFLISKNNKYSLNQRIAGITPKNNISSFFLSSLMNRSPYFLKFDDGVSQTNLSKKDVENFAEMYPEFFEQKKISALLKSIDNLLAANQRQLEELKTIKKLAMQKIFDQEWRFNGFTDAWEQCTLKDVSARITRKNSNLESNLPLTISAQDGLVDQNTFFGKTIASKDTTGYFLLKKGEFAYNKSYSKGYPFGAVKRLDKYDEGVLSTLYIVFAPRHISSTFLAVYYDSKSWYKEIYRNAAEGARNHGLLNISSSDFFDSKLTIPSDKNEQRFIGRFIKTIDKLIAANQSKSEQLKKLKKWFMQNMFM